MMDKVKLRLFGAFRAFSDSSAIDLPVSGDLTVAELRMEIKKHLAILRPDLGGSDLVNDSVIASAEMILSEDDRIAERGVLAILPPVCGG